MGRVKIRLPLDEIVMVKEDVEYGVLDIVLEAEDYEEWLPGHEPLVIIGPWTLRSLVEAKTTADELLKWKLETEIKEKKEQDDWTELSDHESITSADEYCQMLADSKREVEEKTGKVMDSFRISNEGLTDLKKRFGEDIEAKIEAVGITVKTE